MTRNGDLVRNRPVTAIIAAERAAARQSVCQDLDIGARKSAGQAMVVEGHLNVPVVLRMANAMVLVQSSVDIRDAVRCLGDCKKQFISTQADLGAAALAKIPIATLIDSAGKCNGAIYAFCDVCGLPVEINTFLTMAPHVTAFEQAFVAMNGMKTT